MRLAVLTQSADRTGGVETYLQSVLPALADRYEVAFWSASTEISGRGAIALPSSVQRLDLPAAPGDAARSLRAWHPDLLFAHGLDDPILEAAVLSVAPSVVVQHTYHGTCVSGGKTMTRPVVAQCTRPFGRGCLLQYFPRRCGGASPLTMATLYRAQSLRLATLKHATAVVTLSDHMAEELRRNGVEGPRIHVVPPFVVPVCCGHGTPRRLSRETIRLLYMGRLEPLKGVRQLLLALPHVVSRSGRAVRLTVAGDGSQARPLAKLAASLRAADERIHVAFIGWQQDAAKARLFAEADALVMPSIWPEPFGLTGLEAATAGVPAVAFATGGIPEWLRDGENGSLAPAAGGCPERLADAIVRCVESPEQLARLSDGARRSAARWTLQRHLAGLHDVFGQATYKTRQTCLS